MVEVVMTVPSMVDVFQWRLGRHTPNITHPRNPRTNATTSTIGSMTPTRANRRARVYPGVSLKTPNEQSLPASNRVSEMCTSRRIICLMIYVTCFLLPFTSRTLFFFLHLWNWTGVYRTVSRSNGHPSLVMTPQWACSLGTFHHLWTGTL